MDDVTQAAQTIAEFLQVFTLNSGLRLRYRVKLRGGKSAAEEAADGSPAQAADEDCPRKLYVEFTGPDTPALTGRNGEGVPNSFPITPTGDTIAATEK